MAILEKRGYGQLEPNHLSAQATGQIYAQTPANAEIEVLENGCFLKRDVTKDELNVTANTEWMLVYNEVKRYDSAKPGAKDFSLKKEEMLTGEIVPRLYKVNVGDIFTTNLVDLEGPATPGITLEVHTGPEGYEHVGILTQSEVGDMPGSMAFEVIKATTMPDGQPAVKVHRIR